MEIEFVNEEKDSCEIKIDNLTITELMRFYLYENGAEFAAWRRVHPSKPLVFKIESKEKSVKKAVSDTVASIKKDCDKLLALVKK